MNKYILNGIFALLFTIVFTNIAYATKIDKIIIFGDSMSDTGNVFKLTTALHKVTSLIPVLPKNPPYYEGRFTNGPVWVENLAKRMNVPLEDYAYGGSWAEPISDSKLNIPFGLDIQVNYYLVKAVLDHHVDKHLYIIWTGANDYIQGRKDPEYATTNTVASIKKNLEWLLFYKAKNILVLNVPNLGLVPLVTEKGREFADHISSLTQLHNKKLAAMLEQVRAAHPDALIISGDTAENFTDILINPTKYNFTNVTDACYGGGFWFKANMADFREIKAAKDSNLEIMNVPSFREAYLTSRIAAPGASCEHPDTYLFWDHLHPTQNAHQMFADIALKKLTEKGIES